MIDRGLMILMGTVWLIVYCFQREDINLLLTQLWFIGSFLVQNED